MDSRYSDGKHVNLVFTLIELLPNVLWSEPQRMPHHNMGEKFVDSVDSLNNMFKCLLPEDLDSRPMAS